MFEVRSTALVLGALQAGLASGCGAAQPLPPRPPVVNVGPAAPTERTVDATVEDADEKTLALRDLKGQPIIVFYEDKESGALNDPLKQELGRWLDDDAALKAAVVIVAVADVSDYNSWPAKGFAKDAIRAESKKSGTTIWCDWDGSFGKALELRAGTSSVVVIGRAGTVRFSADGALPATQRKTVESLLREEATAPTK